MWGREKTSYRSKAVRTGDPWRGEQILHPAPLSWPVNSNFPAKGQILWQMVKHRAVISQWFWAACQALTKGGWGTHCCWWHEHTSPWQDVMGWLFSKRGWLHKISAASPGCAVAEPALSGCSRAPSNYAHFPSLLEGLEQRAEGKLISWMNEHKWFGKTLGWGRWFLPQGNNIWVAKHQGLGQMSIELFKITSLEFLAPEQYSSLSCC